MKVDFDINDIDFDSADDYEIEAFIETAFDKLIRQEYIDEVFDHIIDSIEDKKLIDELKNNRGYYVYNTDMETNTDDL